MSLKRPLRCTASTGLSNYNVYIYHNIAQQERMNSIETQQTQSPLVDDIDRLENMHRVAKEIDRINREYRCLRQFQDPFLLSLRRVFIEQQQKQKQQQPSSSFIDRVFQHHSPLSSQLNKRHSTLV